MKEESELLETSIFDKNVSSQNHFIKNVVICRKKTESTCILFFERHDKDQKNANFNNT